MARLSLNMRGSYDNPGVNTDGIGNREPNAYHPTVSVLLIMVLLELGFVLLMRFSFRNTHGG